MQKSFLLAEGSYGKNDPQSYTQGSGGGSGGSIQLTMRSLVGDETHLDIKGGNGSPNGGGGGSGGRMIINYLTSYMRSSYPMQSHFWTGT